MVLRSVSGWDVGPERFLSESGRYNREKGRWTLDLFKLNLGKRLEYVRPSNSGEFQKI